MTLAIIATHPIQYQAPVFRAVQERYGVPVCAVYGSDFSIAGYRDSGFGTRFAWDTDLLSGYQSSFLSRVQTGGADNPSSVSARGLLRALDLCKPNAILLTGHAFSFHRQAILKTMGRSYPILYRAEATDHARSRSPVKAGVRDIALRFLYRRCQAILYIGQHAYQHYARLRVPEEKLYFSPYCVDVTPFRVDEEARRQTRQQVRHQLQIDDAKLVVGFFGKLIPVKAPELIVEAVRLLPQDLRSRIELLFVGDGELRAQLAQQAASASAIPCHFVGFQNQHALSPYYHAADLMVLPSRRNETWGLVVNEALHHGVPSVVSDGVGCAPDLVEPGVTGEIFSTGDATDLAAALQRASLLTHRESTRMHCRRKVADYSIDRAAQGIVQAYQRVIASPPSKVTPP